MSYRRSAVSCVRPAGGPATRAGGSPPTAGHGWQFFFFQAEDGIRDVAVTGVQTCALPIFVAAAGTAFVESRITSSGVILCREMLQSRFSSPALMPSTTVLAARFPMASRG